MLLDAGGGGGGGGVLKSSVKEVPKRIEYTLNYNFIHIANGFYNVTSTFSAKSVIKIDNVPPLLYHA